MSICTSLSYKSLLTGKPCCDRRLTYRTKVATYPITLGRKWKLGKELEIRKVLDAVSWMLQLPLSDSFDSDGTIDSVD